MESLRAFGQLGKVALLERLSERIEEAPDVARLERFMSGLPPLMEDGRNAAVAAHAYVHRADDEVVGGFVVDLRFLVGGDALVLIMPLRHELADGALGDLGQIAHDEPGVLPGEFHLAGKAQVVANEHARAGDNAGGERFVVRIAQPQHPTVIRIGLAAADFHEAKVAMAVMGEAVGLDAKGEPVGGDRLLDRLDEPVMGNGTPAFGRRRSSYRLHLWQGGGAGTAVQDEVGRRAPGRRFENSIHG